MSVWQVFRLSKLGGCIELHSFCFYEPAAREAARRLAKRHPKAKFRRHPAYPGHLFVDSEWGIRKYNRQRILS